VVLILITLIPQIKKNKMSNFIFKHNYRSYVNLPSEIQNAAGLPELVKTISKQREELEQSIEIFNKKMTVYRRLPEEKRVKLVNLIKDSQELKKSGVEISITLNDSLFDPITSHIPPNDKFSDDWREPYETVVQRQETNSPDNFMLPPRTLVMKPMYQKISGLDNSNPYTDQPPIIDIQHNKADGAPLGYIGANLDTFNYIGASQSKDYDFPFEKSNPEDNHLGDIVLCPVGQNNDSLCGIHEVNSDSPKSQNDPL
jgi:hypothetical protein